MSINTVSNLLIIIGIIWIIAGYFTYMQTVRVNRIMQELSPLAERLYTGSNARFLLTRYIIFAAVSDNGRIIEARLLRTAFIFRPARAEAFDIILGRNIFTLDPETFDISPSVKKALFSLIKDAKKRN